MKHIESVNEWFGKELGDDFIKDLILILKDENIEIRHYFKHDYCFTIDNIRYEIDYKEIDWSKMVDYYYIEFQNNNKKSKLKISGKYYREIKNLYKKQQKEIKKREEEEVLKSLPKVSKLDRTTKKYNL